jgi:hypothetical protein
LAVKRDAEEVFAVSKLRSIADEKKGVFSRIFDCFLRVFETLL